MSKKISCIVVDDDKLFQSIIEGFIKKTEFLDLISVFNTAIEASNFLGQNRIDLIFLDIEMPEMSGLQLLKSMTEKPHIILISSNREYALDAFEYKVTDYILKPLDNYSRFLKAVNRVKSDLETHEDYIFVKVDNKHVKVKYADIDYLEAYGDYLKIYTGSEYHLVLTGLKAMLQKLPEAYFMQTHRSYAVRLDKIESIEGNSIKIGEKFIPLSRGMKEEVLKKIM